MIDYLEKFSSVDCSKLLTKDRDQVNEKIKKLVEGGFEKLQVVSDFDQTITKQHLNGKKFSHVFALLNACPSVPKEVVKSATDLEKKFSVISRDSSIPQSEKLVLMAECWNKTIDFYKGVNIPQEEIDKVSLEQAAPVRDNAKEFFEKLKKEDVPVFLLSAGIGEFLEAILTNAGITHGSNIELAANYFKRDNEGRIQGYQSPIITTANKYHYDIKNTQFYKKTSNRPNVLVLGDHLGDVEIVKKLDHVNNVLKIGFFYGEAEEILPMWMNTYDIVIKDDQTMNVPRAIIHLLEQQ